MRSGCPAKWPLHAQPFVSSVTAPTPSQSRSQKSKPMRLACSLPPAVFHRVSPQGYTHHFPPECAAPATSPSYSLPRFHSICCKPQKLACHPRTAVPTLESTLPPPCSSSCPRARRHAHHYLSLRELQSLPLPCQRSHETCEPLSCSQRQSPPAGHPSCTRNTGASRPG